VCDPYVLAAVCTLLMRPGHLTGERAHDLESSSWCGCLVTCDVWCVGKYKLFWWTSQDGVVKLARI